MKKRNMILGMVGCVMGFAVMLFAYPIMAQNINIQVEINDFQTPGGIINQPVTGSTNVDVSQENQAPTGGNGQGSAAGASGGPSATGSSGGGPSGGAPTARLGNIAPKPHVPVAKHQAAPELNAAQTARVLPLTGNPAMGFMLAISTVLGLYAVAHKRKKELTQK